MPNRSFLHEVRKVLLARFLHDFKAITVLKSHNNSISAATGHSLRVRSLGLGQSDLPKVTQVIRGGVGT